MPDAASLSDPDAVVTEFVRRCAALDLDRACELVADDCVYENVPIGVVHGPDGIREVFGQMTGVIDASEWVVHRQVAIGDLVVNERTDRFGIGGRFVDLPVAGFFEVRDGKIVLWRDYFDMPTLMNGITELTAGSGT